jgi:DNA-directed RNA polymerase subunit RPC12/RpoP
LARQQRHGVEIKTEKKDIRPKCPHCGGRVEHLIIIKGGWFADHRVYCCPKCEKIVGVNFSL